MSNGATHARAVLDAWRERGADRVDPVRFHFIEALDRRAAGHSGEARRILDDRLSTLLDDYAAELERTASKTDADADADADAGSVAEPCESTARGALAGLVDHIARRAPLDSDDPADIAKLHPSSWPELAILDYFRETWSKIRTEKQMRHSLDQVPRNAGPLNSSSLVHRSLSLMRELSPGYLTQFLSYVDALSWLEQMNGGGALADKTTPARKSTRSRSR